MKKLLFLFFCLFIFSIALNAQTREIKGTVTDGKDATPLLGVTVQVIGQDGAYAITDMNGKYAMKINSQATKLKFIFLGYLDVEVPLTSKTIYNLTMQPNAEQLSEVVVTALGISREKKTLGYSVQEVKSDELNLNKSTNIINTLQGKVAGVQITSGGSAVGSSSRIVIRGNGGFSGNSPLWVVDGVPINSSSTSLGGAGGVDYGSAVSDLDANNIASMTILKGASASALYGSRALNGVIVVTTKQGSGKSNHIGVEINSSFISQVPTYYPKLQNEYGSGLWGDEYSYNTRTDSNDNLFKDIYSNYNDYVNGEVYSYVDGRNGINEGTLSWGARFDSGLNVNQWSTGENSAWNSRSDNIKSLFDNGYDLENNVSITSNGDKASGRISFTNLESKGIVPYTDQSQNTVNITTTLKPIDKLTIKSSMTYLRKKSDNLQKAGYSYGDIYAWIGRDYDWKYLRELYEDKGLNESDTPQSDNFFWSLDNKTNSFNRERIYGNMNAKYDITDWLNVAFRYGIDSYLQRKESIVPSTSWAMIKKGKNGSFNRSNYSYREDNMDAFINFDKTFNKVRVDGFLGGNYRYLKTTYEYMRVSDLTVPDLYTMSNVKGTPIVTNSLYRIKSKSIFFQANASYDDWAFIGITGRNDWNSTLPSDNNSYFYPALNLGVNLTKALDIKSDILSYAKPRFNIAQVGGATSAYQLEEVYSLSSYNSVTTMSPTYKSAPIDLKPQMATSWEIGADVRMFKNRLNLDLTYYERTTKDMIMSVPTTLTTGYSSMLINAGEIENKGIEIMAGYKILENYNGFDWDVNFNWATNKNMVNELYPGISTYKISNGFGSCWVMAEVGKEWGQLYGKAYARTDDGQIINTAAGVPKTGDTKYLGKVTPDWTGGFSTTLRYKGFTLNALIDMSFGNDIFSTTMWHSYPTGAYNNTVDGGIRENGIIGPGVIEVTDNAGNVTYKPNDVRLSAEDYYNSGWMWNNHEYSILDGSYIKLRELSLTYNFHFNEQFPIKGLSVSLTCRNAAILYRCKECRELGIDPETQFGGTESGIGIENFNLPGTRAYGFKLNLKF